MEVGDALGKEDGDALDMEVGDALGACEKVFLHPFPQAA